MRDETIRQYQRLLRKVVEYNKLTDNSLTISQLKLVIIKWFNCQAKTAERHMKSMERVRLIESNNDKVIILYTK